MSKSVDQKKYFSKNPIKKFLIKKFLTKINNVFKKIDAKNILEAGCGDGYIIEYLNNNSAKKYAISGFDISDEKITHAAKINKHAHLYKDNIYNTSQKSDSFDLVLCLEVLEHLQNPEKALLELKRITKKYCLISVPHEPFFSLGNFMFGKNIRKFGRDKEHINFWNKKQVVNLINNYFHIRSIDTSFPWIIILAEK